MFKKALAKRLDKPHVLSAELSGDLRSCYKIRLRPSGYRLVHQMDDGKTHCISHRSWPQGRQ
nr:hypothetical protein [Acetobacter oryzoeni]